MRRLILIASLFLLILSIPLQADAYVSVKGYTRKDGTYVAPHVRSNPNGLKYDNYSYTPSQELYNETYGTRGTEWDTPTWTTDPDYYEGKALYEANQSGSASSGYSVPTVSESTSSWISDDTYTEPYVSVFADSGNSVAETPQIEAEPIQTVQSEEDHDGLVVYQSPYPTVRVGDEVELKIGVKNLGLNKWNTWDNWLDSTTKQRIFVNEWQQPADVNQEITGDDTGVFIKKFKSDHPGQFTVHIQPRLWNRNIKLRDNFGNTDIFWLVNVGE